MHSLQNYYKIIWEIGAADTYYYANSLSTFDDKQLQSHVSLCLDQ